MTEFEELRELAAQTRHFIGASHDKVWALKAIVRAHDVVLGIYPAPDGLGLHVIKGDTILQEIADSGAHRDYSHTAIALHSQQQVVALQRLLLN